MKFPTKFRIQAPTDDGSDGGSGPVDRGDSVDGMDPDLDLDPDNPDGELDPEAAAAADAKADKLKAEIDGEGEGEKEKGRKDSRIPLSRHKEILEKERNARAELEQRLAQYQQGNQIAAVNADITALENDIMEKEKEYANLLTDGEIDKATAVMAQIRRAEREMAESKSDMKIHAAEARNTERARYGISLERIEAAFPELNPDHDDFDEDVLAEVVDLKDAYQMKGLTPTMALQKAVKLLVEPRTTKQEIATTSQPRVNEKDVAAERKTEAVKKMAGMRQPPNAARVGVDSDKMGGGRLDAKQVMDMSQREFAALNDADLARMRGDVI